MTKSVIIDLVVPQCPRCRRAMEVREHDCLRRKQLAQPFYDSRWYRCAYADCRTTFVMPTQFIIWNKHPAAEQLRRSRAIREQLRPRDECGPL